MLAAIELDKSEHHQMLRIKVKIKITRLLNRVQIMKILKTLQTLK